MIDFRDDRYPRHLRLAGGGCGHRPTGAYIATPRHGQQGRAVLQADLAVLATMPLPDRLQVGKVDGFPKMRPINAVYILRLAARHQARGQIFDSRAKKAGTV
ncbi:hypothetical protein [Afipia birgiae]|uniref:hypothetical protein n=1 Tax=Afipia birgiae TaxID=151414 RepID=UPI0003615ACD|nr:hypothetical protein [Afipia birgiae]